MIGFWVPNTIILKVLGPENITWVLGPLGFVTDHDLSINLTYSQARQFSGAFKAIIPRRHDAFLGVAKARHIRV